MITFLIRFASEKPSNSDLILARALRQDSVATLKKNALGRLSIDEIIVFSGQWEENRIRLPKWRNILLLAPNVFEVAKVFDGKEEILSAERFQVQLRQFREIEVEQQMLSDLEEDFIATREEFIPHDDDWLSP